MNARHCRVAQTGGQREHIVGSWPLISSFLQAVTNVIRLLLTLCTVLSVVLQTRPPEWVVQCEGVKEIVEGLVPYTERHFQRLSRLLQVSSTWLKDYTMQLVCYSQHVYFLQLSMFVDYTWQCMKLPAVRTSLQGRTPPDSTTTTPGEDYIVTILRSFFFKWLFEPCHVGLFTHTLF